MQGAMIRATARATTNRKNTIPTARATARATATKATKPKNKI